MRVPDLWTAIAVVLIGLFVVLRAQTFPDLGGGASPRLFPQIVGGLLMVLGSAIAVRSLALAGWRQRWERPDWLDDRMKIARLLYVPLAIVGFILAAPTLGAIASSVVLTGLFALLWRERPVPALVFALVFSTAIFLFFTQVMRVPLPAGVIPLPF